MTTLNKTNISDKILLSDKNLQNTAAEKTMSNSVWPKIPSMQYVNQQ